MSPLTLALWICGAVTAACWLASVLTREYSWTDRVWSIAPVAYAWVFAARADDARATLVAILVSLWGARLTFNFARKGGYAPGGEDYRWAILRGLLPGWRFAAFNLLFIAAYQNALLLLITLPVWTVAQNPGSLGAADAVLAVVFILLSRRGDGRRPAALELPPRPPCRGCSAQRCQAQRCSAHRPVPLQPAPQLLLRDRAVVGGVRLCGNRCWQACGSPPRQARCSSRSCSSARRCSRSGCPYSATPSTPTTGAPPRCSSPGGPPADLRRPCPQDVTPRGISTSRRQPWLRPSTPTRVGAMVTSLVPAVRDLSHWRDLLSRAKNA